MRTLGNLVFLFVGVGFGAFATAMLLGDPRIAQAKPNDRFEDYIMCTGAVALNPRSPSDGVWILDYRRGKLIGTVIDRTQGKISGWAEVDVASEFGITPKSECHFLMTTGVIAAGQAAVYVAEVSSGKFGVYTMGPDVHTKSGVGIRRHDVTSFRNSP